MGVIKCGWDGRGVSLHWPQGLEGESVYDPLRGVPVAELEVIKEGKLRHG